LAELRFVDRVSSSSYWWGSETRLFRKVGFLGGAKVCRSRKFFELLVGFRNPTFSKSRVSCRS
jgi:hypothetical protein